MNGEEPGDRPRHRDGADADVELLRRRAEVGEARMEVELRRIASSSRCLDEEIVEQRLAPGRLRQEEAATAERGQHRLGHGGDRKSTRLNSRTNAHLVCRLLRATKNHYHPRVERSEQKTV